MSRRTVLWRGLQIWLVTLVGVAALVPVAAAASSTETVRDEFTTIAYDGDNGTQDWNDAWVEFPLGDGPDAGNVRVVADPECTTGNCLRIGGDAPNTVWPSLSRSADLAGATTATLTYHFRREQLVAPVDGRVRVRITSDGFNWTTLATYRYDTTDPGMSIASFDVTDWIDTDTRIAFWATGTFTGYVYIDNVQISYGATNQPPIIDPLPVDRSDPELTPLTYSIESTDPDGDDAALEYRAEGLPNGLSIDSDTGVISGTPTHGAYSASPHTVTITVTDEDRARATATFVWTITGANRAPTIEPIADRTIDEGTRLTVDVAAGDPDLPADTLHFSLASAPSRAAINASTGRIVWDTDEADGPGTYPITVVVKDGASPPATASTSFTVTVRETNRAPQLSSLPDRINGVGDTVGFTAAAADPDLPANQLRYTATGLPSGITIGPTSGIISGTTGAAGSYAVTITVTDDGVPRRSDTEEFAWDVITGNRAPILAAMADQLPDADGVVRFTARATDPDGDSLTFRMIDAPPGATIDPASGEFRWTPGASAAGSTFTFSIRVSDDGSPSLSDEREVVVVVAQPNRPPELNGVPDQVSAEGDGITLALAATDPDGDDLTWSVGGLPPGLQLGRGGVITGVIDYTAAEGSPHLVTVTVRDGGVPALTDETVFEWTVENTNRPPELADLTITVIGATPTAIDLDPVDPDGDLVTLTVVEPPAGSLIRTASTFTYVAPDGFYGSDGFVVAADDGTDRTLATIRLTVRATNAAPVAADDTYDVVTGTVLEIDAPGVLASDSDADGDPLTAVLVTSTRHGTIDLGVDGSFVYVPGRDFTGTDEFEYRASDGAGGAATAVVRIRVSPSWIVTADEADVLTGARDAALTSAVIAGEPSRLDAGIDPAGDLSMSRTVLAIARESFATVPAMRFPLALLVLALFLGLTVGRISLIPAWARRARGRGLVRTFDLGAGFGLIAPAGGGADVFVHVSAVGSSDVLTVGDSVEYVAGDSHGRPTATKVWKIEPA